uniref:SSD domain-containing protein n=1 Tax=Macrostomum lignano TaxID=282301 RepID=A0A1I8F2U2_9PLAT
SAPKHPGARPRLRAASSPIDRLARALSSVGLRHGYTRRPCLDPGDPQCPRPPGQGQPQRAGHAEPWLLRLRREAHQLASEKLIGRRQPRPGHWPADQRPGSAQRLAGRRGEQPAREPIFVAFNEQQSVNEALGEATRAVHWTKWSLLIAGCCAYVMAVLFDSHSLLHSQLTVACLTLPLLLLSVTGGLGLACWCRVPLDLLSVQVLPFVQLGIGTFYCLLMANCYNHLYQTSEPAQHHAVIPVLMQRTAPQTLAFLLPTDCSWPCCACRRGLPFWPPTAPDGGASEADLVCCRLARESASAKLSLPRSLGSRLDRRVARCLSTRRRRWLAAILAGIGVGSACLLGGVACWRLAELTDYNPVELLPARCQEFTFLANRKTVAAVPRPRRAAIRQIAAAAARSGWMSSGPGCCGCKSRFDEDVRLGSISTRLSSKEDGLNFTEAASDEGILAAHLLVQTGRFDEYDLT